ncbi:MAG: tape measure protein [Comamonadaceae bacterium]|nr:tape measure protein [Comamonadaceae bacterium]
MTDNVSIRLTGDGAQLAKQQLDGVGQSIAGLSAAARRYGHYAAAVFGASELVQAGRAFLHLADGYKELSAALGLVSTSAAAAAVAQTELFRIAAQSGAPVAELATIYRRTAVNAMDAGLSQQQVLSVTRTLANSMIVSGGSMKSMRARRWRGTGAWSPQGAAGERSARRGAGWLQNLSVSVY